MDKNLSIFEMVDPDIVEAAEEFIEEIKNNTIRKVTLPNEYEEYSDEVALESIKKLNCDPEVEKRVVEFYDHKKR